MDDAPGLTRAELKRLDRLACAEYGLPGAVLMENAGRGAAEEVLSLLADRARRVAVFAGPGNNGGDACVVARHLANARIEVEVFASSPIEELSGDAAIMRRAVERMEIPVHDVSSAEGLARARAALERAAVVVDGLLGTGFHGEARPKIARLIEAVNACRRERGVAVVALDLPSGLDADTGKPSRPTVIADLTVTFAALKVGFDAPEAKPCLGRVVLATIGAPAALLERVRSRGSRAQPGS